MLKIGTNEIDRTTSVLKADRKRKLWVFVVIVTGALHDVKNANEIVVVQDRLIDRFPVSEDDGKLE